VLACIIEIWSYLFTCTGFILTGVKN